MKILGPDLGILILRLVGGITMLVAHGWPKLTGFSDKMDVFPDPLGIGSSFSLALAVGAEVFAAVALCFGIFTRLSAIPLFITMAVAFFIVHANDPFGQKELAFVFMGIYLSLIVSGGGKLVAFKGRQWFTQ